MWLIGRVRRPPPFRVRPPAERSEGAGPTSERVYRLAERTQDPLSKGGAYLRAHGYQRAGGFLLPPDDPKRPASWEKEVAYFYQGLDAMGVAYERFPVPYEGATLRALYIPAPPSAEQKPLLVLTGGFDSTLEELYLVIGKAAADRGYQALIYEGPARGRRYATVSPSRINGNGRPGPSSTSSSGSTGSRRKS